MVYVLTAERRVTPAALTLPMLASERQLEVGLS